MSQTNFTPISLYYSTTASAVPTAANLVPGELAINTNDGKLYYEDSSGVVQVLATKSTGSIGGSNTQVQFNNSGSLGGSSGLTWDGSFLTTSSIKNSALTSGRVTYAGASGLLSDSANLTWDNANARLGIAQGAPTQRLDVNGNVIIPLNNSYYLYTTDYGVGTGSGLEIFTGTADSIRFIRNGKAGTETMRITGAGNVGIGTTSPTNSASYTTLEVKGPSEGGIIAANYNNSVYMRIFANSNNIGYVGTNSDHPVAFVINGSEKMRLDTSGNLGLGVTPSAWASSFKSLQVGATVSLSAFTGNTGLYLGNNFYYDGANKFIGTGYASEYVQTGGQHQWQTSTASGTANGAVTFTQAMTLDSSGNLLVGKTVNDTTTNGCNISAAGRGSFSSNGQAVGDYNRTGDDGVLVNFLQDGTIEGTISVSGSTVSYNGGHLSRWSQWQNQLGQPDIYRGTVLESTNDMCEWSQTNEQSTKTIVSTTAKSKAVAGVFDMYDFDDKNNPNDFYVAQSGDFVIRIAQGVVVENGDLLESAGDGTARPQTDDICRSSTIAKVTSNYVSTTYADGSFCVPCILMIG